MIDPTILYALLGSFALLFALSALEKYQDVTAFRQQLLDYKVLPTIVVPPVAAAIVTAEVIAATLLITQAYEWGVLIGFVILIGYTLGLLVNLFRGRTHIDCGCLGSQGEGISYLHVTRNLLLLCLLTLCTLTPDIRQLLWIDYGVIFISVSAAAGLYATMTLLIANHAQQRLWWS